MPCVYIFRGSSGRHYIGSAIVILTHSAQHLRGHTAMTRRLDDTFEIVAKKQIPSLGDAAKLERILKQKIHRS